MSMDCIKWFWPVSGNSEHNLIYKFHSSVTTIKFYNWKMQVMRQVLTNQSALLFFYDIASWDSDVWQKSCALYAVICVYVLVVVACVPLKLSFTSIFILYNRLWTGFRKTFRLNLWSKEVNSRDRTKERSLVNCLSMIIELWASLYYFYP